MPTLTVYSLEGRTLCAAVVVYCVLAIDLEGAEIYHLRPAQVPCAVRRRPGCIARYPVHKRDASPFLLHAEGYPIDSVENFLVYRSALHRAGVPAEIHVFAKGGHAFGLRPNGSAILRWPEMVEEWLVAIGMIGPER